jgi:formate dehydrogenase major subunit
MRRLHLSEPLIETDLPDDWEVLQLIENKINGSFNYEDSQEIWNEVTEVAHRRFSGAKYYRMKRHAKRGMQWPIYIEDTPILHLLDFRTDDGLGNFIYKQYQPRGMVQEILDKIFYKNNSLKGFYLTTGRTLAHYNNSAQTKRSKKLLTKYNEDVILASIKDKDILSDRVILKSSYGQTAELPIKFSDKIRPRTLFVTFHHSKSRVNALFGDEADELVATARFKSVKVDVISIF